MGDKLITLLELADYLKVTRTTIDRWRKEGMPCIKVGRGVRFNKEAVMQWIGKNKQN
ncbi:helix-turn-helix domain-containing protein [Petroclostridium sp. X23]|uniref:helix-turn-helix transcriptional regulator n=1 Tax=Petroclostridium sp. X23 TaxID=3045146 RepID=UPI0024ACE85B|nr:helix-turn-helix domain-containing protein [Petroclostridium sp. X23]WHH58497.1 helix-turn-helix domain-containing protein [Petroclostridium sp. X23]